VIKALYPDLAERVRDRVELDEKTGCWNWKGSAKKGVLTLSLLGERRSALRASWVAFRGEIAAGQHVTRTCGNALCVNPEHLQLRDVGHGRATKMCANGHVREEGNARGRCRECEKQRWEQRKKEMRETVEVAYGKQVASWFVRNHQSNLKRYGLSEQQFALMLEGQDCKCAICGIGLEVQSDEHNERPCIDHCHATGKVRGILCSLCNKGIGALRDSATLCERASQYLRVGTMPTLCVSGDCESPMRVTH
jgi:hypothetical protein